jgi:hypothetical protein
VLSAQAPGAAEVMAIAIIVIAIATRKVLSIFPADFIFILL